MKDQKMKAIVYAKYGSPDVLQLQEVDKPIPQDREIRVRIYATSVTAADSMMRKGIPYFGRLFLGLRKPKKPIPGTGFAGEIEAIGKDVKRFKIGDRVFGESVFGSGTNAEYTCVPENGVMTTMPNNMTYEEAAPLCDGTLTSLNFLRNMANIQPGQRVLINGASGSLGTAAVQLAKYFGAEVTGVCSTSNLELVKSLGADMVTDYTTDDFTNMGETYDIIYDTVGKSSFSHCKRVLSPSGSYLSPVLSLSLLFQMLKTSIFGRKKAKFSATGIRPASELQILLEELKVIVESNELKSLVSNIYTLDQIVEAHQHVDTGHKKGNIVIAIPHEHHSPQSFAPLHSASIT